MWLTSTAADHYHSGIHIWDVDFTLFALQRKCVLAVEIVFLVCTGLVKISILLFFRRLGDRGVSKAFRITTWCAIGSIVVSTIAFTLAALLGCIPLEATWEQVNELKIASGFKYRCGNEGVSITAAGVVSTFQDVVSALLTNFIYWKAQIPLRQKAALMCIFAISYGAAAFGALRTRASYVLFLET